MSQTGGLSNFVADVVDSRAKEPGLLALSWSDGTGDVNRITFRDLSIRASKVANMLYHEGLRRGDHILIVLPLCVEWWESILGCMKLGAVAVLASDASDAERLTRQLKESGSVALITGTEHAEMIESIEDQVSCIRRRVLIGWERDGWVDYDRRVSLSPAAFETAPTGPDEVCLIVLDDDSKESTAVYTHGDSSFDIALLDAWREGMMLTLTQTD